MAHQRAAMITSALQSARAIEDNSGADYLTADCGQKRLLQEE
jgi:hypothetical protein